MFERCVKYSPIFCLFLLIFFDLKQILTPSRAGRAVEKMETLNDNYLKRCFNWLLIPSSIF